MNKNHKTSFFYANNAQLKNEREHLFPLIPRSAELNLKLFTMHILLPLEAWPMSHNFLNLH